jgi:hypothetical protein
MGWFCVMTQIELQYVDAQCGRDGLVRYWYFRRGGRRWRLPGEPGSPEFMAEYHRLLAVTGTAPTSKGEVLRGSVAALVAD